MTMDKKESTYYKDHLPNLIQRLKDSIPKIEKIIDQDIDDDIKDDKLFNVLKAKRQATEDVIWTMKRIDELENELNNTIVEAKAVTNPSKQFAKKK